MFAFEVQLEADGVYAIFVEGGAVVDNANLPNEASEILEFQFGIVFPSLFFIILEMISRAFYQRENPNRLVMALRPRIVARPNRRARRAWSPSRPRRIGKAAQSRILRMF